MLRSMTMLNERGDTTIAWSPDRDEEVERIIQKKMSEGIRFFIIADRGLRMPLKNIADVVPSRTLAIPDEDWSAFVGEGKGEAIKTPDEPVKKSRLSKNAKEVAASQSVGVKPLRGG